MLTVALYVVVLSSIIGATALMLKAAPTVGEHVIPTDPGRQQSLDGLRGILALTVMIHHNLLNQRFKVVSLDVLQAHPVLNQLGSGSVALFFMISAYLFGSRLLKADGKLRILSFFYGRAMRIVPAYAVTVALVVIAAFCAQGLQLEVPLHKLAREVGRYFFFDFVTRYDINGVAGSRDLIGVAWTLRYEWLFYFCVPVMAWLYRISGSKLALYIPLLAAALFYDSRFYFFVTGLATAQLVALNSDAARSRWAISAFVCLAMLPSAFYTSDGLPQALFLTPVLVAVIQGETWSWLLKSRPLRFLGEISYSVYLVHGVVIFGAQSMLGMKLYGLSGMAFVPAATITGVTVVLVATLMHLLVERPFMHASLRRRRRLPTPDSSTPRHLSA